METHSHWSWLRWQVRVERRMVASDYLVSGRAPCE